MDKPITFIVLFIVLSGAAYYVWQERGSSLPVVQLEPATVVEPRAAVGPVVEDQSVRYPVPEQLIVPVEKKQVETKIEANAIPLPPLNESDAVMQEILGRYYRAGNLNEIFVFNEFIRHVVVSIDNMTTKKLPQRFVFTQKPGAGFMTIPAAVENEYLLDEHNFTRYRRFLQFADVVDNQQLVSVYVRYYPLFQQAYDELGYSGRYFNDRLIEVIDHLLQTPEVQGPIKLLRPKVYYQFADPDLESLSAGQKILLRIGHGNALLVKSRLKALRRILTTLKPGQ